MCGEEGPGRVRVRVHVGGEGRTLCRVPRAASPGHCAFGLTYVSERGVTLFVNEGAGAQAW